MTTSPSDSVEPEQESTTKAVTRVWEAWRERQARPEICRLTDDRKRLIKSRIREYSADDLIAVIDYAYDAEEPGPRFWRGENADSRTYLDLDNLYRVGKLAARVEAARLWQSGGSADPEGGPEGTGAVNLGPMAAFQGRGGDLPSRHPSPARPAPRASQPLQARSFRRGR